VLFIDSTRDGILYAGSGWKIIKEAAQHVAYYRDFGTRQEGQLFKSPHKIIVPEGAYWKLSINGWVYAELNGSSDLTFTPNDKCSKRHPHLIEVHGKVALQTAENIAIGGYQHLVTVWTEDRQLNQFVVEKYTGYDLRVTNYGNPFGINVNGNESGLDDKKVAFIDDRAAKITQSRSFPSDWSPPYPRDMWGCNHPVAAFLNAIVGSYGLSGFICSKHVDTTDDHLLWQCTFDMEDNIPKTLKNLTEAAGLVKFTIKNNFLILSRRPLFASLSYRLAMASP
jgi:hypothetical protein